jgi:hypothetical protein
MRFVLEMKEDNLHHKNAIIGSYISFGKEQLLELVGGVSAWRRRLNAIAAVLSGKAGPARRPAATA